MDFSLFTRIVDQLLPEVKKVYLMKQGEPFIIKNLEAYVEYLRARHPRIHISLHTNGILAKKSRLSRIIPLIDSLGVSISAINRDTYKKAHGVDKFTSVTSNLEDLSDLMLDIPKKQRPNVFIDYIRQEANQEVTTVEAVEYFSVNFPGLSSVDFHWVYNFHGTTGRGDLKIYNRLNYGEFPVCVFPWSSITVCHDGKVDYCFVEPREDTFLGDANEKSLVEIWNGTPYADFRRMMLERDYGKMLSNGYGCGKCSWLWSMKAQSPKNLCGGYTLDTGSGTLKLARFEDLLDKSPEAIFNTAVGYYLDGQINLALSLCIFIEHTGNKSGPVTKMSKKLSKYCLQAHDKYAKLHKWRCGLAKEGQSAETMKCEYYKIGG